MWSKWHWSSRSNRISIECPDSWHSFRCHLTHTTLLPKHHCGPSTPQALSMEALPRIRLGSDPPRHGHRTSGGDLWCLATRLWRQIFWVQWVARWGMHRLCSSTAHGSVGLGICWPGYGLVVLVTFLRPFLSSFCNVAGHTVLLQELLSLGNVIAIRACNSSRTLDCNKIIMSFATPISGVDVLADLCIV